jgi:LAS superfamily LD-carboxypeptidase LdcB
MEKPLAFQPAELTGHSRAQIVDHTAPRCSLHRLVMPRFLALREAAAVDGIDLQPLSSYRDFDRQLTIWNEKCRGQRPLLGAHGQPLDVQQLDEAQLIEAILLWSALPGTSRHHWGTDLDVVDAAAMPAGYVPQLVPEEFAVGGVFQRLDQWLGDRSAQFGFYRPYSVYRGGVQPEPWHISYAPLAEQARQQFSAPLLAQVLAQATMDAGTIVQQSLGDLVVRFVYNVDAPPLGVA